MLEEHSLDKIISYLSFIQELELLKNVSRTAWCSGGKQESTADHSWRLAVFAGILLDEFPQLDREKVFLMALIHDVGEIYDGDISAVLRPNPEEKYQQERAAAEKLFSLLPQEQGKQYLALWQEYEDGQTKEARFVKALDKAETIIQHNQGRNPEGFDYHFNLAYGASLFQQEPVLQELRKLIDEETQESIKNTLP